MAPDLHSMVNRGDIVLHHAPGERYGKVLERDLPKIAARRRINLQSLSARMANAEASRRSDEARWAKFRQTRTAELDDLQDQQILDLFNQRSYLTYDVVRRDGVKVTKTTTGVRLQASTAKGNNIIAVMVELLTLAPSTTAEETERHSVQAEPSATWRNWVEIPRRLYYGTLDRLAGE